MWNYVYVRGRGETMPPGTIPYTNLYESYRPLQRVEKL